MWKRRMEEDRKTGVEITKVEITGKKSSGRTDRCRNEKLKIMENSGVEVSNEGESWGSGDFDKGMPSTLYRLTVVWLYVWTT